MEEPFAIDLAGIPPAIQQVIANHLLSERPSRAPDYKSEVEATSEVIKALRETPGSVLTTLSYAVKRLTGADSAGVSLSGRDDGNRILLWQAAVGLFEKYLGSVVPHAESPCGTVLETDKIILMVDPAKAYKTAAQIDPPMREVLLVPFHVDGRVAGTVWLISQSAKTFDAEDARLATNISELAALAYQVLTRLGDMELLSRTVQLAADSHFMQRPLATSRLAS
ncbi:GAF domain-containing protein [Polaromonas sp. YR568]|uniref:GAF domain-containing protein n=1 Tax=Polaromonas sp. YR568 TaxID=1855301 RepID=UPI0008E71793|nr:GAF domain-containing protein [Polaromonas sp. YR568]SFU60769.1 GAF domain-containing protein [Polaromonas sp. YR568]